MGFYATMKGEQFTKCPKCGAPASWQSKGMWLNYKGREIFIGYEQEIELDENMSGHVVAYCAAGYSSHIEAESCAPVFYKIIKGQLIESTEEEYRL